MTELSCPDCQSKFADKNEISMHIDRIHVVAELLKGDKRQF